MAWHGPGRAVEAPGDVGLAPGPRQSMHKLLIQKQQGGLQRQAGKLKVKESPKPFWSAGRAPLRGGLGGEGAAGRAGEEDLLGFGILASPAEDLSHVAAWMLTLGRRCSPGSRSPSLPLRDYLGELEFGEGGKRGSHGGWGLQ